MSTPDTQPNSELPSSGKLLRSTVIAAAVAALLLVTVVMPAEYGVDPTGIGRVLGLTEMGEIKAQLAKEVEADAAADRAAAQAEPGSSGPAGTAGGGPATTQAAIATPGMLSALFAQPRCWRAECTHSVCDDDERCAHIGCDRHPKSR